MADYSLQYPGATIDALLGKVNNPDSSPTANSTNLVTSGGVKSYVDGKTGDLSNLNTTAKTNLVAAINEVKQSAGGDSVKYSPQTLTAEQKAQARTNIAAASAAELGQIVTEITGIEADIDSLEAAVAAINNGDYVTAAALPTASASTMGHIYLIGPDANDNYDRYFTQESGGAYSWVSLGSTQIDLSTYATKAEVSQLDALIIGGTTSELIDLTQYSNTGYFLGQLSPYPWNATGYNSNKSNSIVIPLAGINNLKVKLTGKGDIAFLKTFNPSQNTPGDFSATYPGVISLEDQTATYNTIPSDANFLYVKTAISSGASTLDRYEISTEITSSGAIFRDEIVDRLNSNSTTTPLSANQGMVLNEKINGGIGKNYKRIHPITQFGESRNGTITSVYDSEYAKIDVEKFRGTTIIVHNLHSSTGCSQILDANNAVLATFSGEDTMVGAVTIPDTAKWFVISNSFVKNPDFYVSVPSELGDNDGLIFGENFLFKYDKGDFSQFNGTVTDGYGLVLGGTGASNGLIVDRVIPLDNWSLVADILTANNAERVVLGTKITQGASANHSTRVEVDFSAGTIKIYNNSTNALVQSGDVSGIVSGNIYSVKLERIDRAIYATLLNRTTGASVSINSPDGAEGSGSEGVNPAGKMFDSPVYYIGSGTPYLQNLYATCLRGAKALIVGDSITAGAHTTVETSWAQMAAEYFGDSITGGRGSGDVLCCLNELRSLLPVVKPKAVVVTIGTNYNSSVSKTGYVGLFKSIINVIREYGATPIINNVCACDARNTGLTIINEVVNELKQIGCRFDLATSLNNDWDDGQDSQYYYTDNVHLNVAGNALLYGIITTQLGWLKNI